MIHFWQGYRKPSFDIDHSFSIALHLIRVYFKDDDVGLSYAVKGVINRDPIFHCHVNGMPECHDLMAVIGSTIKLFGELSITTEMI